MQLSSGETSLDQGIHSSNCMTPVFVKPHSVRPTCSKPLAAEVIRVTGRRSEKYGLNLIWITPAKGIMLCFPSPPPERR